MNAPGRSGRSRKKGRADTESPVKPTKIPPGALPGAGASKPTRSRGFHVPKKPSWKGPPSRRIPVEDRDLTDPDQLQQWMAEQLRDFQVLTGAAEFEKLITVMEAELAVARKEREDIIGMEPRAIGFVEGKVHAYEHLLVQMRKAAEARRRAVGEEVKSW